MLVKSDMTRGDHPSCGEIKAPIPTMIGGIAEKDAGCRAWTEFMWRDGTLIGEIKATKHPQMIVCRRGTKQELVWRECATSLA